MAKRQRVPAHRRDPSRRARGRASSPFCCSRQFGSGAPNRGSAEEPLPAYSGGLEPRQSLRRARGGPLRADLPAHCQDCPSRWPRRKGRVVAKHRAISNRAGSPWVSGDVVASLARFQPPIARSCDWPGHRLADANRRQIHTKSPSPRQLRSPRPKCEVSVPAHRHEYVSAGQQLDACEPDGDRLLH